MQIPFAFRAYNQFILYKIVPSRTRPGKTDKFPVDFRTGRVVEAGGGGAHDSAIWMSADQALAMLTHWRGFVDGIGFVFTERDPFWFLDIDHCLVGGQWSPIAQYLCSALAGAAIEISSSGDGLHLFGSGVVPPHGTRYKPHGLEFYTSGRFVALTGTGATGDAALDCSGVIAWLVATYFSTNNEPNAMHAAWSTEPIPEWNGPKDDDDLIRRACNPKASLRDISGKARFPDLWNANAPVLALTYPPDAGSDDVFGASEADAALAAMLLFWTGRNCERTKSLMWKSALVRPKWERDDYLDRTILNSLAINRDVCIDKPIVEAPRPAPRAELTAEYRSTSGFVPTADLSQVFDGCVYVQDRNDILLPNGDLVDQSRFNAIFSGRAYCLDTLNEKVAKTAWDAFFNNALIRFPQVQGTIFRPDIPFRAPVTQFGREWVNVYSPPEVDRRPGDVSIFLNLIQRLLPRGDDALILISYLCAVVQYPGKKFRWTIFLQGTEGNGKSLIVRCLKYALGNKYIINVSSKMLLNEFNGWLENHVLYIADDIHSVADKSEVMDKLRTMITEPDHPITYKGIDAVGKQICGNWLILDNHLDGVKITEDGRRYCPLHCAQQSARERDADGLTESYFTETLIPWLEKDGFAFVAEYLATAPIDPRYDPSKRGNAPASSSKATAIEAGRTIFETDVCEWIEIGEPGFCGGYVSTTMLKRRLDKPVSHLRIKETLIRLGYVFLGRTTGEVMPDAYRPTIYAKPGLPIEGYAAAQMDAITRRLT